MVALVVAAFFVAPSALSGPYLAGAARSGLETWNGATVDVDSVELDLAAGRLAVSGLAMADPNALGTDLFRAARLEADVGTEDLLRKKIVIDRLVVVDGATGASRSNPGALVGPPPAPAPPTEEETSGGVLDPGKSLEDYLADAEVWKERLAQVREWLEALSSDEGGGEGGEVVGGGGLLALSLVPPYDFTFAGELVVEYQGRRESLRQLSEQTLTTALQRLSYADEQWVVFLEGHGERSVAGTDNQNDYNRFAEVLREKGLKVQALNLARTPAIPDNTSVLVIASPRSALLPGEIDLVNAWVRDGGNLLWLADPDHPTGLAPLAETLGARWQDGFAVFPEYELLGTGHPGIFVALDYPPGPVTRGLNEVTLFPLVRSVESLPDSGWNAQPYMATTTTPAPSSTTSRVFATAPIAASTSPNARMHGHNDGLGMCGSGAVGSFTSTSRPPSAHKGSRLCTVGSTLKL